MRFNAHPSPAGRDIAQLLADLGHPLPIHQRPAPTARAERLWRPASRRGRTAVGAGWASACAPLSVWRMTSDQTPVLWPLIAAPGLPPTGAQIGIDLQSGGAFYCDPFGWVTDDRIPVTNPNIFVFGKPGRGKSATVKVFCLRMMDLGYRSLILGDVKDEYATICHALGVQSFALGPGQPARINPLDLGTQHQPDAAVASRAWADRVLTRWLVLLRGLIGSQTISGHPVPFGPSDETAISAALRDLTGHADGTSRLREVTIPQLWHALDEPSPALVRHCRYPTRRDFHDQTRLTRDALANLVSGHLRGLFDAPTTIRPNWHASIQSLSLSRLAPLGDDAVGIALLCLNSWGQAVRDQAAPGDRRIIVRDETWKQMRLGIEPIKSLDANLRLSRSDADIQIVVYHKPSDPLSVGGAGSQAVAIAKDLLHLADIKILHGQDPAIAAQFGDLLDLTPTCQELISGWAMTGTGRALWLVGDRPHQVQTVHTPTETILTDTNQALAT